MTQPATIDSEAALVSDEMALTHYNHSTVVEEFEEALKEFQLVVKRVISFSGAFADNNFKEDFINSKAVNAIESEINSSSDMAEKRSDRPSLHNDITTDPLPFVRDASSNVPALIEREPLEELEKMQNLTANKEFNDRQPTTILQNEIKKGNCDQKLQISMEFILINIK